MFITDYQNSMGNGGHAEISKRYYEKGSYTWVIASRLGYETPLLENQSQLPAHQWQCPFPDAT